MKNLLSVLLFLVVSGFAADAFSNCYVCTSLPNGDMPCFHFRNMSCADWGDLSSFRSGCADVGTLSAIGAGNTGGDHLYRTNDGGAVIVTRAGKRYIVAGDDLEKWTVANKKQITASKERWGEFTKRVSQPQKVSDSSLQKLSKEIGLPIEKEPTTKPIKR